MVRGEDNESSNADTTTHGGFNRTVIQRQYVNLILWHLLNFKRGGFRAKMGSINDRNGMDLAEAEDVKKRWQEYTEELSRKGLHDQDNQDGMI